MKKTTFILLSFVFVLLTSCAGVSDWAYELPNGFEMWRINSNEVIVKYAKDSTKDIGIPSFIKEFSYDERYVFTRNISSINNNNIFDEEYYILDTEEQSLYGPFKSLEEFGLELKKLEISDLKWFRTSPDPNASNIPETEN